MPHILYCKTEDAAAKDGQSLKDLRISELSRLEHRLGRELLSFGLKELYGLSLSVPELSRALSVTPDGKPYLPGHPEVHFSISHSDGIVCCAFHETEIGVDTEFPHHFSEVLIRRMLTEEEKSLLQREAETESLRQEWFYRLFTLKEAYVKMTGSGLDTDLRAFSFDFVRENGQLCPRCSIGNICCFQTVLPEGNLLSLCYPAPERTVTVRLVR